MLLDMTHLEAQPRVGFLGAVRYIPARKRAWRPASRRLSQPEVHEGEPSALQRYANVGIMVVGFLTATVAWRYRDKFLGFLALGAGTGAVGVGLAFLTLDLIGVVPGKGTV
jgi:small-conductance mechanosensitive channel